MAGLIIGSLITATTVTIIELAVAWQPRAIAGADDVRDLLLNAAGIHTRRPGQERIPVLVDGVEYEVVVTKLGEPRVVPVAQ